MNFIKSCQIDAVRKQHFSIHYSSKDWQIFEAAGNSMTKIVHMWKLTTEKKEPVQARYSSCDTKFEYDQFGWP